MQIDQIYFNPIFSKIFHTLVSSLRSELVDCESVLDLGCGPNSPLQFCKNVKTKVGVEAFEPYLKESKRKKIHTQYIYKKIEEVDFPPKIFDAVIMIEVLEHLSQKDGEEILKRAQKWAKKKIIISTPNGFFPMENVDKNRWQKHLSGWTVENFVKRGFKVRGNAGVKFLYKNSNQVTSMTESGEKNRYQNIKYNPKKLFFVLNSLIQIFSYYFPPISFELFAVKKLK